MQWPEWNSIRGRLLWHLGIVFACGLVALYLAATSYARLAADRSFDRLLLGSAGSIAETVSVTPGEIRVDIPYAALDMLSAAPDDKVFYRVIGTDGNTVTGYADLPNDPATQSRSRTAEPTHYFDSRYRGDGVRFVMMGREVRTSGDSGWIWVQVGQTLEARDAFTRDMTIRALAPILALTVLAVLVSWATVSRAVRPIEAIGRNLESRSASDLSPITSPVPDEIAPMVRAVNEFMSRLENNIGVLRTFIATAAHQLRTPLTALLVQIRSAETSSAAARGKSLSAASQSANRLARLVDQLLSDAMVAHRAEERCAIEFDLKKVIEQSLQETLPISHEADIRFTTNLSQAPMVGDDVMVAEAIKNLLHNALRHGGSADPDNNSIELILQERNDGLELAISDSGCGMTEVELADVGERFKIGSSGRGGAGLGLAIVVQVAKSHRGTLSLANRDGGGLRVTLWFPSP